VRKFTLFGFITLLSYQFVGFFTFVELEHYFIRKDIKTVIKASVPENQLISFHFTIKESKKLRWIKPHEFQLHGRFYDVIKKKKHNGVWYFRCIDDREETTLFKKLDFAAASNLVNSPNQHPVHGWLKLMNEPIEPISSLEVKLLNFAINDTQSMGSALNHYLSRFLPILVPPPEV
jgi:hypothetical protein